MSSGSRTLRADLVQHLMDEGQASLLVLMELSGYPAPAVRMALYALRDAGLCLRTKSRDAAGYSLPLYGLTLAGIEAALAAEARSKTPTT